MNLKHNITITRTPMGSAASRIAVCLAVTVALLAVPVFAHEGFDHVMGTVAKISGNVLTVKTAKGDVDVKLDEKTIYTKDTQKALVTDLKIGMRVVVDIPEGAKVKIAHSVKLGAVVPTDHDSHQ